MHGRDGDARSLRARRTVTAGPAELRLRIAVAVLSCPAATPRDARPAPPEARAATLRDRAAFTAGVAWGRP
jgi:hypothetical protein